MGYPRIYEEVFDLEKTGGALTDETPYHGNKIPIDGTTIVAGEDGMISAASSLPLFTILWRAVDAISTSGLRLDVDNGQLPRAAYPDAATKIDALLSAGSSSVSATDEDWLTEKTANGVCGRFSPGDGITYFRIPYWANLVTPAAGRTGDGIGDFVPDEMRPITGDISFSSLHGLVDSSAVAKGALTKGATAGGRPTAGSASANNIGINSSLLGNPYNGDITHGPLIIQVPVLIMYHTITDPAALNAAEVVQAVAGKLDAEAYAADEQRRLKAWAVVSSSGSILIASGFASCSRTATGRFTYTLSSPMTNVNYGVLLSINSERTDVAAFFGSIDGGKTATRFGVTMVSAGGGAVDKEHYVAVI